MKIYDNITWEFIFNSSNEPSINNQDFFFPFYNSLNVLKIVNISDYSSSLINLIDLRFNINWRLPSLSELTPMMFNMGLPHLGSDASI